MGMTRLQGRKVFSADVIWPDWRAKAWGFQDGLALLCQHLAMDIRRLPFGVDIFSRNKYGYHILVPTEDDLPIALKVPISSFSIEGYNHYSCPVPLKFGTGSHSDSMTSLASKCPNNPDH